jgi:two-component system, response regulator YesN
MQINGKTKKMKKNNLSDRVVEFVLNCPIDEFHSLTVTKIAATFRVNRCYLSRKFKSDKDFTLCEFLIREKLSRSVGLLKEDKDLTIRELSAKMGFSNTNYFIQIFKNYYGTPPGRYREYISRSLN